jgi:hypothetical protein
VKGAPMKKSNPFLAKEIVKAILDDFTDRRGLRQAWDPIDDEIKDDVLKTWLLSTKRILDENDSR